MLAMQHALSKPFYVLLSLPATAMGFALSVQISALSWILTTQYGLDIHEVGLVWAAGPISGIIGQVLIGIISDKVWFWQGRRRPFILIGGTLAGLMLLALPNIEVISDLGLGGILGVAIAIALTLDLSINVSFNPTRSLIADVTPVGIKRTQGYTWMQTISGSFGVLAYAIGAYFGNLVLIYFGAVLVLLLSLIPPFFIAEPRQLAAEPSSEEVASEIQDSAKSSESPSSESPSSKPISEQQNSPPSFRQMLWILQPLWGFILYDIYAIVVQLADIKVDHYYVEITLVLISILLLIKTFRVNSRNKSSVELGILEFKQVLAAHSFSWVGVQTMFVFMFAFLQDKMPSLDDDQLGQIIALSFLVLSAVSALLPALVLAPISKKIGKVNTQTLCIASMAIGYLALVLLGSNQVYLYGVMAWLGIGWAAMISLPFAIMSEKIQQTQMGLFMGLFNLSVVLPQLLVSLGIGLFISKAADKGLVFQISAVALAISAICWFMVGETQERDA